MIFDSVREKKYIFLIYFILFLYQFFIDIYLILSIGYKKAYDCNIIKWNYFKDMKQKPL